MGGWWLLGRLRELELRELTDQEFRSSSQLARMLASMGKALLVRDGPRPAGAALGRPPARAALTMHPPSRRAGWPSLVRPALGRR